MSTTPGGVSIDWNGDRPQTRQGDAAQRTAEIRRLLAQSDVLLDALERLNLGDQTRAPRALEGAVLWLIGTVVEGGVRTRTVQGLLDALFEAQQSILIALRASRTEQQLQASRWHRPPRGGPGRGQTDRSPGPPRQRVRVSCAMGGRQRPAVGTARMPDPLTVGTGHQHVTGGPGSAIPAGSHPAPRS